jgi:Leucine Rich repeat
MLAVLALGACTGWIVTRARTQRDAVTVVRRAGGGVTYGSQYLGGTMYDRSGKPWWYPTWLIKRVGIDYFDSVVQVVFVNDKDKCTDDILRGISKLHQLQWLAIGGKKVTDSGLENLREMTSLTRLDLATAAIGDDGASHLSGLYRLEALDLAYTGVGDDGLKHLKGLTNLAFLRLEKTKLTDSGLPFLRGLTNLVQLDLTNTEVTDDGINNLKKSLGSVTIIR